MAKIAKPIRFDAARKIPPRDAVAHSVTPDGMQLYRRTVPRSRPVPLLDKDGEQVFAKHPLNGEALYPKNKPEFYTDDHLFFLEDEGNGNVRMQRYTLPSPEETAKEARRLAVKSMEGKLAEALVDAGVNSVEDLVSRLAAVKPVSQAHASPLPASQGTPEVEGGSEGGKEDLTNPEPTLGVPEHTGAGWWKLSDGGKIRGTKEAAEAKELEIYEAKQNARAVPEI